MIYVLHMYMYVQITPISKGEYFFLVCRSFTKGSNFYYFLFKYRNQKDFPDWAGTALKRKNKGSKLVCSTLTRLVDSEDEQKHSIVAYH